MRATGAVLPADPALLIHPSVAPREGELSGVGFLREAREKCLSTGHCLSQVLDFIEMVSVLI